MVYIDLTGLGEGYGIADLDAGFCYLGNVSDIIIGLHCLQHSLQRLYVTVQPLTLSLQPLDPLLVFTKLLPDLVQVSAGYR